MLLLVILKIKITVNSILQNSRFNLEKLDYSFVQEMKIEQLEMFYDASQFIQTFRGGRCPADTNGI